MKPAAYGFDLYYFKEPAQIPQMYFLIGKCEISIQENFHFQVYGYILLFFQQFSLYLLQKETIFVLFQWLKLFQNGVRSFRGTNSFLEKFTRSEKGEKLKMVELLPLKLYPLLFR